MLKKILTISSLFLLLAGICLSSEAYAETCERAAHSVNARLSDRIDEHELADMLRTLNSSHNRNLPAKFLTKREAQAQGWRLGRDLWSVRGLRGYSIGGDRFSNRERSLPYGKWREADLDYKGGRRGAKRLLFSQEGRRFITADHYRTFVEVPSCR